MKKLSVYSLAALCSLVVFLFSVGLFFGASGAWELNPFNLCFIGGLSWFAAFFICCSAGLLIFSIIVSDLQKS